MTDPKKMSIEEILAAARKADGGDDAPANDPPESEAAETPAEPAAEPSAPAKDPKKMSVEEMLAAARASDKGGGAAKDEPAEEAPAPAAAAKDPKKMSVEEMLAAARASDKAGGAAKDKPKPKAGAKPKAKAAPKKSAAPAEASGPKDTASILAAARKSAKPGPITKAEAKARGEGGAKGKAKPAVPPMPEKPTYAQRSAPRAAAPAAEDRRGFLGSVMGAFLGSAMAVGFSSLAVTNILWTLGLARFMFPNILTEPPTRFKVGFPGDYAPGQVEAKFKAQFGVWIVRYEYQGEQQLYALKSVCTHLGCTPNWLEGEQKFKCPCHGSGFYKDGINFEGPAPRPLERYAIRLADDGQVEVDKSRKFNEELGQWADSASFVQV